MDLGEAMARAAGWIERKTATMIPVLVNKYKTPMAANPDCQWSLGILNLTEAEAEIIAQFARGIRSVNSPRAQGLTATEMRERSNLVDQSGKRCGAQCRSPEKCYAQNFCDIRWRESSARANGGETERERGDEITRAKMIRAEALKRTYGSPEEMKRETAREWLTGEWDAPTSEPELTEPGNRFSGLDIPDEPK